MLKNSAADGKPIREKICKPEFLDFLRDFEIDGAQYQKRAGWK
jgi:hypothetical protein